MRPLRVLRAAALCAAAVPGAARAGCAGDADPGELRGVASPSALFTARALPHAGRDLSLRAGDPGDAGRRLYAGTARLALCGRVPLRRGELRYNLGYEPYEVTEAARPDAWPGGRLLAAELGYTPWRWLGIYGGLRKVAFSYGHDEPEEALALPVRPFLSNSLAPDRRLGLTVDSDWGPVRVVAGLYETARTFAAYPSSDVLVTARGVMEPFGPVGRSISTRDDDPSWRRRLRVAFNVSALLDWDPRGGRPVGLVIGGDLPIKYGPLGVVVEYLYGYNAPSEDPGAAPGLRAHRQGAWAQASLMLLRPYLELEGRYEWLDAPTRPLQRFHALTAGVTSSLVRDYLKVQAAYGTRLHYGGPAVQDDYLLLQLQVAE